MVSFAAIRWLAAIGATFVQFGADGSPLIVSVPPHSPTVTGLRRRQATVTYETGLGKALAHAIIGHKVAGQAAVLQAEGREREAAELDTFRSAVADADNLDALLSVEGKAAAIYWGEFADRMLRFARVDAVPPHWLPIGNRQSPLSGSARNAVSPAQACVNYLYAVMATELTIALHGAGFDPALGILHLDKEDRASLAYDLLELARPAVDAWALR
jgi:CRISP-associated protein Cas1